MIIDDIHVSGVYTIYLTAQGAHTLKVLYNNALDGLNMPFSCLQIFSLEEAWTVARPLQLTGQE